MNKRDHDTERLEPAFDSLPVYLGECEVKRTELAGWIEELAGDVDSNSVWLGRAWGALVLILLLNMATAALGAWAYLRLDAFLAGRAQTAQGFAGETPDTAR